MERKGREKEGEVGGDENEKWIARGGLEPERRRGRTVTRISEQRAVF